MIKKLTVLLVLLLFIVGCGQEEDNAITGGAVVEVSTVTIAAIAENGTTLYDAEIFVNGVYKGKTSKYGKNKGTRTVVLDGDNTITVEKEGYAASEPTSVGASLRGPQFLTVVLESIKTTLTVHSEPQAMIFISSQEHEYSALADELGMASFSVEDGEYTIVAAKEGYEHGTNEVEIDHDDDDSVSVEVELSKLAEVEVEVVGDGKLSDAEVSLYTRKGYNSPGAYPLGNGLTRREGTISFSNVVYDDRYVLIVKAAGYQAQKIEFTLAPGEELFVVHMEEE